MYFCSGQPTHFCSGVDIDEDLKGAKLRKLLANSARDRNSWLLELALRSPNDPELYCGLLLQVAALGFLAEEQGAEASPSTKRGKDLQRSGAGAAARRRRGRADEIRAIYRTLGNHPSHMRARIIAKRLKLNAQYVRKVIRRCPQKGELEKI